MATVNLGSIKFKWKGTYAGGTAYTVDDVVEYNGSSYICILASTGNLPTNATYFEQMSSAGTNGTNGTDLTSTLTTQGDLVYRDGSGLQRLGAGTAGQALITGGAGANPSWGAVAGGKVLQVVTATESTQRNTTSTSFTNASSTLDVAITPSSTSSKILVLCGFGCYSSGDFGVSIFQEISGSAEVNLGTASSGFQRLRDKSTANMIYLDSPSTTNQINYRVKIKATDSQTSSINYDDTQGSIIAIEIGA
jgi:hypothetical protein